MDSQKSNQAFDKEQPKKGSFQPRVKLTLLELPSTSKQPLRQAPPIPLRQAPPVPLRQAPPVPLRQAPQIPICPQQPSPSTSGTPQPIKQEKHKEPIYVKIVDENLGVDFFTGLMKCSGSAIMVLVDASLNLLPSGLASSERYESQVDEDGNQLYILKIGVEFAVEMAVLLDDTIVFYFRNPLKPVHLTSPIFRVDNPVLMYKNLNNLPSTVIRFYIGEERFYYINQSYLIAERAIPQFYTNQTRFDDILEPELDLPTNFRLLNQTLYSKVVSYLQKDYETNVRLILLKIPRYHGSMTPDEVVKHYMMKQTQSHSSGAKISRWFQRKGKTIRKWFDKC